MTCRSQRWPMLLVFFTVGCAEAQTTAVSLDVSAEVGSDVITDATASDNGPELPTGPTGPTGLPDTNNPVIPTIANVTPALVDPAGGSHLRIDGAHLEAVTTVRIGGVEATRVVKLADGALTVTTGPVAEGPGHAVEVSAPGGDATWSGTVESWSPTGIAGARVFDAAFGISGSDLDPDGKPARSYEWARTTANVHADWRSRDGAAVNWLPATGKYWATGGWNGNPPPKGFGDQFTTNEVWSSPDGVTWTPEMADGHDQWVGRHVHNALVWHDRLWLVGGDNWRGFYQVDVVSSADGRTWEYEPYGTTHTPWSYEPDGSFDPTYTGRLNQMAGIYQGALWVAGGQNIESNVRHNDVWRGTWDAATGLQWELIAPDAPASETRWAPRGSVNQLLEFKGRLWLIGGGNFSWAGSETSADVWSTVDGVTWKQHNAPAWGRRLWNNAQVFDGRLWLINGANDEIEGGNLSETWYSDDGETWTRLPIEAAGLVTHPASHGDGITVGRDANTLLMVGGNYTFQGFLPPYLPPDYSERSAWQLRAFHGDLVESWQDRNHAVTLSALGDARPLADPNGLGDGVPGVQFDGYLARMDLATPDALPASHSVFWVARAPFSMQNRNPQNETQDLDFLYSPAETVVGGGNEQTTAYGLTSGRAHFAELASGRDTGTPDDDAWASGEAGSGLQESPTEVRCVGFTRAADGTVQAWVDGAAEGETAAASALASTWSVLGAGRPYVREVPGQGARANHFGGTLGAVIIAPSELDATTVAKLHAWARGRFLAR